MTQPKLERYVQNISLVTLVVIEGLRLRNYMLTQNAEVNGTIADWASASASFLAVIVACIAAMWAKRASDRTEEISKRSLDVDEFASVNEILRRLSDDAIACYEKTQEHQVGYEYREKALIDFIGSVGNIYIALEKLNVSRNNTIKCRHAIKSYLGENINSLIEKVGYKDLLTNNMRSIYSYMIHHSMERIMAKHNSIAPTLERNGWEITKQ
ncbi:hypothetical protein HLH26_05580 [Gluconacetobacter sp. 1b LMG 1731]|uniref:Uncharacterized protein n=1 Tax=Gluconacetobacter dulcium TaxID=2729096 RepID=A0A7W4IJR6_9PROT|nr:hypothetical protein [Gluconacetobacter dulcium]MBB2164014.1 hypothetical protein [Gluconacetobacter dulcium]MBB2192718.1 hypothetical protein [Gluconacetobacter dulcium]